MIKGRIFNLKLFKKLMVFVKPYSFYYRLVLITAILLSIFSVITPYLLKIVVDDYIRLKDYDGMKTILLFMLISLIFTVIFQILFVYFANFLGQKVIKNLRVKLFNNIINFKVDYFTFCNSITLEEIDEFEANTLLAIAVNLGGVRLIDNFLIQ